MRKIDDIKVALDTIKLNFENLQRYKNQINLEYETYKNKYEVELLKIKKDFDNNYKFLYTSQFDFLNKQVDCILQTLKNGNYDLYKEIEYKVKNVNDNKTYTFVELIEILKQEISKLNAVLVSLNKIDVNQIIQPKEIKRKGSKIVVKNTYNNTVEAYGIKSNNLDFSNLFAPLKCLISEGIECALVCQKYILIASKTHYIELNKKKFDEVIHTNFCNAINEMLESFNTKFNEFMQKTIYNAEILNELRIYFSNYLNNEKKYKIDPKVGALDFYDYIHVGNMNNDINSFMKLNSDLLKSFKEYMPLKNIINDNHLQLPIYLDLKRRGNILLNIDEDIYSEETLNFINQIILKFLLSFPANRLNFCLVDIDNKASFSKYKVLEKINNDILYKGIIRDDRLVENVIKDLEQTMYNIEDNILSYNNVSDIFEYNELYKAHPQSAHLFVLVNYPAGMREDVNKKILKLIQNGNKAGIYTLVINNKQTQLPSSLKQEEYDKFIESLNDYSLVIDKINDNFSLKNLYNSKLAITNSVRVDNLNEIIEVLQENAENSKKQVVPLSHLFEYTDSNKKAKETAAEVLDIPIGARGGEIQNLLLKTTGDGSAHAVVIGGTGSGKSNLLHTIIMNACYKYSPEDLNLYLVDFKGGVEFKFYEANKDVSKQLPHIKLTGLTSDFEDGVAILNNVHKELRRREDLFRQNNVEDIVQYKSLGLKMARLFIIIDEIQELFEYDERLGEKAVNILRELFKKGRAFGINILWASQNVPSVSGLKHKILSQIGNRISLRLNDPEDAEQINISSKVVKNLNRPEKGLGVINDIRYGNDSIEFRVAYAETSENRTAYTKQIIDKWSSQVDLSKQEPLYIVGDDNILTPETVKGIYNSTPSYSDAKSKAFGNYSLVLGLDYISGKTHQLDLAVRGVNENLFVFGSEKEVIQDIIGYSELSVVLNHIMNKDCEKELTKIYHANGDMINPNNQDCLLNILKNDFNNLIDNVSSKNSFKETIKKLYKSFKERKEEVDKSEYDLIYSPYFFIINSLENYSDVFTENESFDINEVENKEEPKQETNDTFNDDAFGFKSIDMSFLSSFSSPSSSTSKGSNNISMADAFKELINSGGKYGIHFVISLDNLSSMRSFVTEFANTKNKLFIKGVNQSTVSYLNADMRAINSLSNYKIGLLNQGDENTKVKLLRYYNDKNYEWYKQLVKSYKGLIK